MKQVIAIILIAACLSLGGQAVYGATGTIGYTGNGASGAISFENTVRGQVTLGGTRLTPSADGDWDSINVYVRTNAQDPAVSYLCRCAIYDNDGITSSTWDGDIIDSTAQFLIVGSTSQLDARYSVPTINNAAAVAGTPYMVVCWAKAGLGVVYMHYDVTTSADSSIQLSRNYTTVPAWPNPATTLLNITDIQYSIYAVYTITPTGGVGGRRRRILLQSHLWKEAQEGFAGSGDHIEK